MSESTSDTEQWLPVAGYEGYYEVSNHGRVRGLARWILTKTGVRRFLSGCILRPAIGSHGYLAVVLNRDGNRQCKCVHDLVLHAFVGPQPAPNMECLHGPNGKLDNRPEHLSWGTRSDNMLDTSIHGTNHNRNLTHCLRGHLLQEPNLVSCTNTRGYRNCLACNRAMSTERYYNTIGKSYDIQNGSDQHFSEIMAGISHKKVSHKTHCPRKHLLQAPNLVSHKLPNRCCLSCKRAQTEHHYYTKTGRIYDVQTHADAFYAKIMSNTK